MKYYPIDFTVDGGNKSAEIVCKESLINDVLFVDIEMTMPVAEVPEKFTVKWSVSGADSCSVWSPFNRNHIIRPDWSNVESVSRLASGMPIQQIISPSGKNKLCVSVSDVDTPIRINMGYCEENADIYCQVDFFTLPTNKKDKYSAQLRIDMRDTEFYDSIYDTVNWWENECGYASAFVPEAARLPVDSLWYSFHQNLEREKLLEECRLSKELGMETVIIDDGWQTDDNNRGYAYCGDWKVCEKKMGDMCSLVEEIHKIGMKVVLWYSVPFVGLYSEKYEEFKNFFLDKSGNEKDFWALDPRYKKVRDYLCGIYETAVNEWKLDGLKLDFIDSFNLKGESLEYDSERDYQSLEDAIHALMCEIKERLVAINKDILIEFRQSYVGPSIRKYGNMLRVGDCPGDTLTNRSQIVNLRMTSGKTAVHSDMVMWNKNDTVENAALQLASVIFSVPQISVLIKELPEEHIKMLKFYLSFWKEYKNVLIDGKLTALNPESDYSQVRSVNKNKSVVAVYTNPVVNVDTDECVLVNATHSCFIAVKGAAGMTYKVLNCQGIALSSGFVASDFEELKVPVSGLAFLSRS